MASETQKNVILGRLKTWGKSLRSTKKELQIYVSQNLNFTTTDMGRYFNISSLGALLDPLRNKYFIVF